MHTADPDLETKSDQINARVRPSTKRLTDRLAERLDTTRSRAVAVAIRQMADEVLDEDGAVEIVVGADVR